MSNYNLIPPPSAPPCAAHFTGIPHPSQVNIGKKEYRSIDLNNVTIDLRDYIEKIQAVNNGVDPKTEEYKKQIADLEDKIVKLTGPEQLTFQVPNPNTATQEEIAKFYKEVEKMNITRDKLNAETSLAGKDPEYLKKLWDKYSAFEEVLKEEKKNKKGVFTRIGNNVRRVRNFLSKRKQCVVIDGTKSRFVEVISGIPQGTVLAGLLFLVFINDLPESVTN